jgi:hypothetical protein
MQQLGFGGNTLKVTSHLLADFPHCGKGLEFLFF